MAIICFWLLLMAFVGNINTCSSEPLPPNHSEKLQVIKVWWFEDRTFEWVWNWTMNCNVGSNQDGSYFCIQNSPCSIWIRDKHPVLQATLMWRQKHPGFDRYPYQGPRLGFISVGERKTVRMKWRFSVSFPVSFFCVEELQIKMLLRRKMCTSLDS